MAQSNRLRVFLALLLAITASIPLALPQPAQADLASVLLDVPWRTQIDGLPDQHDNAGVVGIGMVLSAFGSPASTRSLRAQHDRLEGVAHAPVTSVSLANLAIAVGLVPQSLDLWSGRAGDELRFQIEQGRPVLLWLGPGETPSTQRWVVAIGFREGGEIVFNDPGFPLPMYGQMRLLKANEEREWLANGAVGIVLTLGTPPAREEAAPPAAMPFVGSPGFPDSPAQAQPAGTRGTGLAAERGEAAGAGPIRPRGGVDGSPYWWRLIETYAAWFNLDPYYVAAVVLAESGGDPSAVGDQGRSVGLMQLHDAGVGTGLWDLRYDPSVNLWHGTKALATGMARFGDPYQTYARYYNPGGEVAGERVMAWYRWLWDLGQQSEQSTVGASPGATYSTSANLTQGGLQ